MNTNYKFPVSLVPAKASGIVIPKKLAVVREDEKKIIGLVSEKYALLPHEKVVNAVREVVPKKSVEHISLVREGAMMLLQYDLPQEAEVAKGDIVRARLIVRNSYDGSSTLSFTLGALRLACTNGMVMGHDYMTFSKKHTSEIEMGGFSETMEKFTSDFLKSVSFLKDMLRIPYEAELPESWVKSKTPLSRVFSKKLLIEVREEYNKSEGKLKGNMWGLYNACTSVITHSMPKANDLRRFNMLRGTWACMPKMASKS